MKKSYFILLLFSLYKQDYPKKMEFIQNINNQSIMQCFDLMLFEDVNVKDFITSNPENFVIFQQDSDGILYNGACFSLDFLRGQLNIRENYMYDVENIKLLELWIQLQVGEIVALVSIKDILNLFYGDYRLWVLQPIGKVFKNTISKF